MEYSGFLSCPQKEKGLLSVWLQAFVNVSAVIAEWYSGLFWWNRFFAKSDWFYTNKRFCTPNGCTKSLLAAPYNLCNSVCVQLLRITTHNKLFQTSSAILSSCLSIFRSAAQIKTVSGEIGKSLYFDLMILENSSASASKLSKSLSGTVFFTSSFIFIFPFYRLCCQHLT